MFDIQRSSFITVLPPRPTDLAHDMLRRHIRSGDTVVDATCGNGHDTVFLADCVGPNGKVLAYDIQPQAIDSAKTAVANACLGERVDFHLKSHAQMVDDLAPESASAIMFNLGYLPGDDHALTTETLETLKALEAARSTLAPGGMLSVVCYPGHEQGDHEAKHVESWLSSLTTFRWRVAKYAMLGTKRPAPFLLVANKP